METSLHRSLKSLYAGPDARFEAPVDGFRIDVVCAGRLVEIQHGSLAAIRDKASKLLARHQLTVVKPIVAGKLLVKLDGPGGQVVERRRSPKRGSVLDLFHELVHFTQVFPHERLTLEVPLIEIEEWRYPGHGRRRRWRADDHQVEDQRLVAVEATWRLRTADDVAALLGRAGRGVGLGTVPSFVGQDPPAPQDSADEKGDCPLPQPFHTADLAQGVGVPRWIAQRIAYCLRKIGATREVGKRGNTRLYEWAGRATRRKRRAA